jgi:hypothetical protein
MNDQATNDGNSRVLPLDAVVILLLACSLTLFLLWLAGQVSRNQVVTQLPDFIVKGFGAIWACLTGTCASVLLARLRSSDSPRPNYIFWCFGSTILLLSLVFGSAYLVHGSAPDPSLDNQILVKLWVKFSQQNLPVLNFIEKYPHFRQPRQLNAERDGYYQEYVDWPLTAQQEERVDILPVSFGPSELVNSADPPITVCFKGNPHRPTNNPPLEVHMQCKEAGGCSLSSDDYGWAAECAKQAEAHLMFFSLTPKVFAEAALEGDSKPGWRVPSLTTLQHMPSGNIIGYTEFNLKSESLVGLDQADSFRYEIYANGLPLYVDGLPPEDMREEFNPAKGFDFSFGIENLDFSGQDNGCENIQVALEFLKGDQSIRKLLLTRSYAALRDAVVEQVQPAEGVRFVWSGKYRKLNAADRTEIFALSTSDLNEAKRFSARLKDAHLSYNGMDVVGVLRPPLNKPQYGVIIGLRQPTGQVKFIFSIAVAKEILGWAQGIHASRSSIFRNSPFRYDLKPGDSGAGTMESCRKQSAG